MVLDDIYSSAGGFMKGAAEHRVFTKLSNSDEDSKLSAFTMVSGPDVHELVSGVSCKGGV